jgi:hypothetical protein
LKQASALVNQSHRTFAPYWSNEDALTTIFIRNIDIRQGVSARLSLILKHRTVTLPQTYIDSLQTISIDLAQALIGIGERPGQSGGAYLEFEAESDSALVAYAQVLNADKGLIFNFPFLSGRTPAMPGGPTYPGPLEAVAWYLNKKTDAFVALQNTTDKPATTTVTMFVSGRAISLGQRQLRPLEVTTIKLPSPYGPGPEDGPRSTGVRVEYKGEPGAVEAEGWVVNEETGFSAAITFHKKAGDCHCPDGARHLYGTGIAIGEGAMMGMVPGATFSPYLATRNRSSARITVNPVFSYQVGEQVERVTLPPLSLSPQDSALLDLRQYQLDGLIPAAVNDGSIDLRYEGEAGALIAELASVDQGGSFVSPVPLTCNGQRLAEMAFWRTDGDWHGSVSLLNVAAEQMRVEVKIIYPGGVYEIEKTIAPGATAMVSVNDLQQSQEPDGEGRTIPPDVTSGGVSIRSTNQVGGLVMNAMLVNPVTKTCEECGFYGYVRRCVLTDDNSSFATIKYTIHRQVDEDFAMYIVVTWSTGIQDVVDAEITRNTNPSVATKTGPTTLTSISPGTTSLTGRTFFEFPLDRLCTIYGKLDTSGDLKVIQIKIRRGGNDITNQTSDVIVGQQISLTTEVLPTGTSSSNLAWIIPGNSIENYVVTYTNPTSLTSAAVTQLTNFTSATINFYWVNGADERRVTYSARVGEKTFSVQALFNVKRPTAQITISTGTAQITSSWPPGLGLYLGVPTQVGIAFSSNVTIPSGFTGQTQWVQIWNKFRRVRASDGFWYRSSGSGLDSSYPYSSAAWANDSPGVAFDTHLGVIINESYDMYLMFQPTGLSEPTIWVPLNVVHWSWAGDASFNGSSWVLNSSSNPSNPQAVSTTTHPTWTQNSANILFTREQP